MKPPVLISVVSRSPVCGSNSEPRIIRPSTNIAVIETSSSTPRPLRLSRKWPPPGINQPNATAGAQVPTGGIGCRCSFSLAIKLSLAKGLAAPSLGVQDLAPDHLVRLDLVVQILPCPDEHPRIHG